MGQAITELANYVGQYMNPQTHQTASMTPFYKALGLMMLFFVVTAITMFISSFISSRISAEASGRMRIGLFARIAADDN